MKKETKSKHFLIRMEPKLFKKLKKLAKKEDRTAAGYVRLLIEKAKETK